MCLGHNHQHTLQFQERLQGNTLRAVEGMLRVRFPNVLLVTLVKVLGQHNVPGDSNKQRRALALAQRGAGRPAAPDANTASTANPFCPSQAHTHSPVVPHSLQTCLRTDGGNVRCADLLRSVHVVLHCTPTQKKHGGTGKRGAPQRKSNLQSQCPSA